MRVAATGIEETLDPRPQTLNHKMYTENPKFEKNTVFVRATAIWRVEAKPKPTPYPKHQDMRASLGCREERIR
jgi:hypothetical protein